MTFNFRKFLVTPATNAAGWTKEFPIGDLPVLQCSVYELEDLRDFAEQADAQMLANVVASDPLLTAKVFGFIAERKGKGDGGEAENVRQAILLLGTGPFFRLLGTQLVAAEGILASEPAALSGFQETLERAWRAGRFAGALASQRDDPDAALVQQAAELHFLPELLLWLRAPTLALELARRTAQDTTADADELQRSVLNATLAEIRTELSSAWRLPAAVSQLISGQANPDSLRARLVQLSLKIAQDANPDWQSTANAQTVREVGDLLQLGLQHTWNLLKKLERSPL